MQLFEKHGNTDIQGVDVKNACFGGTAALFSALDWLESSNCDGKFAIDYRGLCIDYAGCWGFGGLLGCHGIDTAIGARR